MEASTSSHPPLAAEPGGAVDRSLRGFLLGIPRAVAGVATGKRSASRIGVSAAAGLSELVLSLSGAALAVFMLTHLGLLSTVLAGARVMDSLASFLERTYLLHIMAPFIVLLLVVHAVLALRKVPATARQQMVLIRQVRGMRHLDTATWGLQIISGMALAALASVHLWVILTSLPIQAASSGGRVYGPYLWLYLPFVLLVEVHVALGLARAAVKWGLLPRFRAHLVLALESLAVLGLGFAILVTFYQLGQLGGAR